MDGNNMNGAPMGPDPNMMGGPQMSPEQYQQPGSQPQQQFGGQPQPQFGGQPQQQFGGQPQQQFGGQPQQQFGGQPQQQFGGQPQQQFGGQPQQQFGGQPQQQFGGQPQQPYGGQPQQPYGGQPQQPYGGQPQQPYGGQPQQPYGGQPQQPYGGQPQAKPGMIYQDTPAPAPQSMNQQNPGYSVPAGGGGKKTGLIIGIIAAVVLLLGGAVALVLIMGGRNIKGAEEISVKFMEDFGDADVAGMKECIPPELMDNEDLELMGTDVESLENMLDEFSEYGFDIQDIEVVSSERVNPKSINDEFNSDNGTNLKFKNAAEVEIESNMHMEFDDETFDEPLNVTFVCAKIGSKWYIVNVDEEETEDTLFGSDDFADDTESTTEGGKDVEGGDTNVDPTGDTDTNTEENTETATGEEDDDITISEALAKNTAESHLVEVPVGVSDNLGDMTFSFDGTVYAVPFKIADLPSSWVLDTSYFYQEDEELDVDEYTSSNPYENSSFDPYFYLYIATYNDTDTTIAYEDSAVRYFDVDIDYTESDNYPEMIIAKGITWHSSLQDVYDCYGEPDYIYEYEDTYDDRQYVYLYYYLEGYDDVCLMVDYKLGVVEIEFNKSTY